MSAAARPHCSEPAIPLPLRPQESERAALAAKLSLLLTQRHHLWEDEEPPPGHRAGHGHQGSRRRGVRGQPSVWTPKKAVDRLRNAVISHSAYLLYPRTSTVHLACTRELSLAGKAFSATLFFPTEPLPLWLLCCGVRGEPVTHVLPTAARARVLLLLGGLSITQAPWPRECTVPLLCTRALS